MLVQKLRSVWIETPKWLRRATEISFGLSASLFAVGVAADALNWWWSEWGFFINVLTSLVGFLFGVPVAIIGLNAISEHREREANIKQARNLTIASWSRLEDATRKMCTDALIDKPPVLAQAIADDFGDICGKVSDFGTNPASTMTLTDFHLELANHADRMEQAITDYLTAVGNQGLLMTHWITIRVNWETINTIIRERRLALDMTWLSQVQEARLVFYIREERPPLQIPAALMSADRTNDYYNGIKHYPGRVRALAGLDKQKALKGYLKLVDQFPIIYFLQESNKQRTTLIGFRDTVKAVTQSPFAQ